MTNKVLRISELGTVCGDNFEILTNKFLKKLEKNYQSDAYNVSYNEKDNNFDITYDGIEYILELDTETMKHYLEGNYNNITLRLKKIINAELDLIEKNEKEREQKRKENIEINRRKHLIEDAKKGIIPNDEARNIYLDYLEKEKKFSLKRILNIFKQSHEDNKKHREKIIRYIYHRDDMFDTPFSFTLGLGLCILICSAFIVATIHAALNSHFKRELNLDFMYLIALGVSIIPTLIYLSPLATYSFHLIKNTIKHLENKKLIKRKIKELKEKLKHTNKKSIAMDTFDKTLDLNKSVGKKANEYKDYVYSEISKLIQRLEYINSSDRKVLLAELRSVLNYYDTGIKEIEKSKDKLSLNGVYNLQNETTKRIAGVELKMTMARIKDMNSEEQKRERMLLEKEIDGCYIDADEIERVQREREEKLLPLTNNDGRGRKLKRRRTLN